MTACGTKLIADWQNAEIWTTQRVAPHRQFDRWREFVIEAHLHWDIRRLACDRFPAFIRQGKFAGFRTSHITAALPGIVGTRRQAEIARDAEALYSFIYVAEGSIRLDIDDREVALFPGHCALWDTARPMRFTCGAGLRQITFSVPQDRMRRLTARVDAHVGRRLDVAQDGAARLFVEHMLALDRNFGELPSHGAARLLETTAELLAVALESSVPPSGSGRDEGLLREICRYIRAHLEDETLAAAAIAAAAGISERHLYRLFARLDTTPAAWIRAQRLEACRRELLAPVSGRCSITDLALRWGFRDPGTFAKIFRRAYGTSPSRLRAAVRRQGAIPARP